MYLSNIFCAGCIYLKKLALKLVCMIAVKKISDKKIVYFFSYCYKASKYKAFNLNKILFNIYY